MLKGIIADEDWHEIKDAIQYDFIADGHFAELKNAELLTDRLRLAAEMQPYIGKYFSVDYVRKNVLKQTPREIEDMNKQIKKEIEDGIIASPEAVDSEFIYKNR